MKVVLDTNTLVSGIFWGGKPSQVLSLWAKKEIEILASPPILNEYLEIIRRISEKLGRQDLYQSWSLALPAKVSLISVKKSFKLCRDPKDNMFIDCAVAGKVLYIISGDQDLLVLNRVLNVQVVDARSFLSVFETGP